MTAASPVSTETTYFNVRGQPDSVKTVIGGQTFWRRYSHNAPRYLAQTMVSGGTITSWQTRQYRYHMPTGSLAGIKVGGWVPTGAAGFQPRRHAWPGSGPLQ
ncbi:MAG: hypothetical protein ACRDH5_11460 [bacterium]